MGCSSAGHTWGSCPGPPEDPLGSGTHLSIPVSLTATRWVSGQAVTSVFWFRVTVTTHMRGTWGGVEEPPSISFIAYNLVRWWGFAPGPHGPMGGVTVGRAEEDGGCMVRVRSARMCECRWCGSVCVCVQCRCGAGVWNSRLGCGVQCSGLGCRVQCWGMGLRTEVWIRAGFGVVVLGSALGYGVQD